MHGDLRVRSEAREPGLRDVYATGMVAEKLYSDTVRFIILYRSECSVNPFSVMYTA